nr:MAG TPA: hypothetical protein [Caudoviricetes sp.]
MLVNYGFSMEWLYILALRIPTTFRNVPHITHWINILVNDGNVKWMIWDGISGHVHLAVSWKEPTSMCRLVGTIALAVE